MRRQLSLRWFLTLAFLSLGLVLMLGYSVLSVQYFVRGMDSIVASNMEQAALGYLGATAHERHEPAASFGGYWVARDWDRLPATIRQPFQGPPSVSNVLVKHDSSGWLQRPDILVFAMRYQQRDATLFVGKVVSAATVSWLVARNVAEGMRLLLVISVLIAVTLGLIIWRLLRRVSRPITALGRWTRTLDVERLQSPLPDFSYPELNELALLIRDSLVSVQDSLEREHRFLRYASHELRTPISVIRGNVELMRRLQEQMGIPPDVRQQSVIDRIDRASLTMQHLTETLLWLSRDTADAPAVRPVRLDRLIRQVVEGMRYLLEAKRVELELATQPQRVELPEEPARIVIGNLIRNAFQHTGEGWVSIRQNGTRLEIVNLQSGEEDLECGLGFGLGLQLTAQLTARLGWDYVNEPGPRGHRVRLDFQVSQDRSKGVDKGQGHWAHGAAENGRQGSEPEGRT